MLLAKSMVFSG
ncbi:hypothetical protein YPPY48_2570, partial [Yersinia pestis PY-48]